MTPQELVMTELRKASDMPDDELLAILSEWELHPFYDGEKLMGVGLIKGTEFHCHLVEGCRFDRKAMREFMVPLLERYGFLTTRVSHDDLSNQRFNKACGFEPTWSDDKYHYSMLNHLPFTRPTCQQ